MSQDIFNFTVQLPAQPLAVPASRPPPRWLVSRGAMWPVAARECLVKHPSSGALVRLDAGEYAILDACAGVKTLAGHEATVVARFQPSPHELPALRECLARLAQRGLMTAVDELVARLGPARAATQAPAVIVVRTADRPALLDRLLASATAREARGGDARAWHVIDDSRSADAQAANRAIIARHHALDIARHGAEAFATLESALTSAFPDARAEIGWLLGASQAAQSTYGRPVNYALLACAGKRILAIDDDAVLEPRLPPLGAPRGFAVDAGNDEWFVYPSEASLQAACTPVALDPLAEHERWLGEPLANAWAAARQEQGNADIALDGDDAGRFSPEARIMFTQNHAVGDPGSALFPYHVLALPPASRAHVLEQHDRQAVAFVDRHGWRGVPRFRLAPRRLLTFTTVAGLDNSRLLPPTCPVQRNEDLLLGALGQLVHADGWFADLPFGLPHRRASAKQWLAPDAVFLQEPLHFLLDTLRERAASILAGEPAERLQAL
ncbi:MAG: hypothetical protein ABI920_05665, partial [Casimicrobiaceae bacterium]